MSESMKGTIQEPPNWTSYLQSHPPEMHPPGHTGMLSGTIMTQLRALLTLTGSWTNTHHADSCSLAFTISFASAWNTFPLSPHMINFPSSVKPEPQYHFLQNPSLLESPGWLHTLSLLSAALSSILKILEGRTCVIDFVIPSTYTVDDLSIRKSKKI